VGASPYPPIEYWRVPQAAVAATLSSVVGAGRRGDEAGVFWLGERAAITEVTAVVSLRGRGVLESPGLWQVSPEVYGVVSRLAVTEGLVLLATAHTHGPGVPVALSLTDRRHGVRVPDFLALVVGDGGAARRPTDWSWNTFDGKDYRRLHRDELTRRVSFISARVSLFRANADGAVVWSGDADD
jgi:hypothetical protein